MKQSKEQIMRTIASLSNPSVASLLGLLGVGIVLVGVALLWWLNRGDWIYPTQPNASQVLEVRLASDSMVGQTFVARQSGLQGVGVKLQPSDALRGQEIFLSVYDAPDENAKILRRVSARVGDITGTGYLYFKFQPLPGSRHQYYYFTLQTNDGTGSIICGCIEPLCGWFCVCKWRTIRCAIGVSS